MSGGRFNYNDHHISDIARQIQEIVETNNSEELDHWGDPIGHHYTSETIAHFHEAVRLLNLANLYVHRIDWLLSGDDGEDNFSKRLEQDLKRLNKHE